MRTPQLLCTAAAIAALTCGAACNRAETREQAQQAAADVKTAAATAGDQLADAWVTTQIQAKYFADRDVKARQIDVSTHDRVVTLQGYVQTPALRDRVVQTAKATNGVREVQDRLTIGEAPANAARQPSVPVATTGRVEHAAGEAGGKIDDARITTTIQAKYFLDPAVKGRRIDVDTRGGVVTLRGEVASAAERSQALLVARETDGVQRVEDMLTVDAALDRDSATSEQGTAVEGVATRFDDGLIVTRLKAKFLMDSQVKAGHLNVAATNGVVTLEGTAPNTAAKEQALQLARDTDGVTQVVDRITVAPH
jgi:hyperosmotically inducible protein